MHHWESWLNMKWILNVGVGLTCSIYIQFIKISYFWHFKQFMISIFVVFNPMCVYHYMTDDHVMTISVHPTPNRVKNKSSLWHVFWNKYQFSSHFQLFSFNSGWLRKYHSYNSYNINILCMTPQWHFCCT